MQEPIAIVGSTNEVVATPTAGNHVRQERIAIVGGGIAGIYTAWRLLQDTGKAFEIHIYEKDSRLGGRIRSQTIPGIPFTAELGAMRFKPRHQLLNAVIDELGIKIRSFDFPPTVYYMRGRRLSSHELAAGRCDNCHGASPFQLREIERGKSPVELVRYAIREVLQGLNFPGLPQSSARQLKRRLREESFKWKNWQDVKKEGFYQGIPLCEIGFWNLLQHFLSNEAYVMVHEVLSLESILGNWNAAEAIAWFLSDFASDQFDMIPGGLLRVATDLVRKIESPENNQGKSTIKIHRSCSVDSIQFGDGKWALTCETGVEHFDYVILALPKIALKKLNVCKDGNRWQPEWLDWVTPHRMFKLFLLYENEWWLGDRLPGHSTGRVFTDLPLRQVYYFGPTWMQRHGVVLDTAEPRSSKPEGEKSDIVKNNLSLLMASYSDEHYVSFWEPLLKSAYDEPYRNQSNKVSEDLWRKILELPPSVIASRRMVEKVQQFLTEMHGRELPRPIVGVVSEWDAGWHTWTVGSQPWTESVVSQRTAPLPNLFLCGEAYSNEQGWIEGALKSAELVLKKIGVCDPLWTRSRGVPDYKEYIGQ
jgi:monoamine oxidase